MLKINYRKTTFCCFVLKIFCNFTAVKKEPNNPLIFNVMKNKFLPFAIASVALLLTTFTTFAQGEWEWANYWTGDQREFYDNLNKITNTAFDEEGNIYVYGTMGGDPKFNGEDFPLPENFLSMNPGWGNDGLNEYLRTRARIEPKTYLVLAKLDPDGNMLWNKIIRPVNMYSNSNEAWACWMELRNDKLYVSGNFGLGNDNYSLCYYLDTLITTKQVREMPEEERKPPFKESLWTWFAQFDLDGNLLEDHFVETYSREIFDDVRYPAFLCFALPSPMHVDNEGNTIVFTSLDYSGNEEDPFTIVIDGDSSRTYDIYIPGNTQIQMYYTVMLKFSPDWELIQVKPIIHHTEGIPIIDGIPMCGIGFAGLSYDEQDNLYLSGCFEDFHPYASDFQYPARVYWDSTHHLTMHDISGGKRTPFVIKYNTDGNVQWCNQIYTKGNDASPLPYARVFWNNNCQDNNSLYIYGGGAYTPNSIASIYFDTENDTLQRCVPHDAGINFFVRYDKQTGEYITHGIVPADETYPSSTPAVINNRIFALSAVDYHSRSLLTQWHIDGWCIDTVTINVTEDAMEVSYGVIANPNGDLLVSLTSRAPVTFTEDIVANCWGGSNAVFALYHNPEFVTPYVDVPTYTESRSDLKLWPNPAQALLNVESEKNQMESISILDMNGKTILHKNITDFQTILDISSLSSGVYFIKAIYQEGIAIEKFVKLGY